MVICLNCLDFGPIKLPKPWIIIGRNTLQHIPHVLAIEQKLEHTVCFVLFLYTLGHRSMRFGSASSKSLGSSFFQISWPVEWNNLPLGQPSILLLMKLLHSSTCQHHGRLQVGEPGLELFCCLYSTVIMPDLSCRKHDTAVFIMVMT